jgi:hypothetical protein
MKQPVYLRIRYTIARSSTAQRLPCGNTIRHSLVGDIVMKLQLGVVSLISLLPFWRGVLAGQIPEVNGILGGMSAPGTITQHEVSESVKRTPGRTPGKLRGIVENSGVCGWLVPSLLYNSTFMPFFRDDPRCLSSFRVW